MTLLLLEVEAVDRKGQPMPGLAKNDFVVRLDGRLWPVATLDDHCGADPTGAGDSPVLKSNASPPIARQAAGVRADRFVLFMDFSQMTLSGRAEALREARRWVAGTRRERFLKTVERLRLAAAGVPAPERARVAFASGPLARLFARRGDRIVPVLARDIRRIEAQGDYAEIHTLAGVFLLHLSLKELAARLDPERFAQVHRSHIVNLNSIDHLRPYDDRRLMIVLRDGSEIVASRTASERLRHGIR